MTEFSDTAIRVMARGMAREATSDAISEDQAVAFRLAVEHVDAAAKTRNAMPDAQHEAEHAEAVVRLHAHVKAANAYLESYRKSLSVPMAAGDDDADVAEAADDPEVRAAIERNRATTAVLMLAGGATAAARRLVRRTPSPRKPRR